MEYSIDYMQSGGILRSTSEYLKRHNFNFEEYSQYGLDYAEGAIIENIIGCFNRFELEQRYPNLNKMTDDRIRTFLFKWMQRYSEQLILRMFHRKIKSADVGNLMDCVNKKYPIKHGEFTSGIERYLPIADREVKHTIHCLNAEKFLKNQQPCM